MKVWHIFIGPKCRPDYGDLRFTDRYGRELAYYLWPDYNSSSARVAVRLEGADAAGVLQVWYGNPSAATTSDGGATYYVHDAFSGSSLDSEKWSAQSAVVTSVVDGVLTAYPSAAHGGIRSATTLPRIPLWVEASIANRNWGDNQNSFGISTVSGATTWYGQNSGLIRFTAATNAWQTWTITQQVNIKTGLDEAYHTYRVRHVPGERPRYDVDVASVQPTTSLPDASYYLWILKAYTPYGDSYWTQIDWVLVRAYSAAPPSLLRTSREILVPPIAAIHPSRAFIPQDIEVVYSIEIAATGSDIVLPYHLLRAQDLATPYGILRAQDLDATYQIEVLKDLLTTYHILIKQETVLPYDIPGGVTFTMIYSVEAEAVLDYRINVGDQVYDPERFWDLVITRKLNQVHTAVFELWTEGADVSDVVEGTTIRIFYNDEVRFAGEIRSIRKDDMSGIWSVECESGACRLADDAVQGVLDYKASPGDQILRAVLPSPAWVGVIDAAPAIDYRQEYADVLSHVTNLASVLGYDWRVRQQEDRYQVTGRTETTITVAGAGWPTSSLVGRVVVVLSGAAKYRAGVVVSHTADTLTFSGTAWVTDGLKPGDAVRVFGPFRLDCRKRIGSTVPRKTFTVNADIFDSSTSRDIERVANAIVVPGTASITQDRKSTISGNTLLMTPITVTEAVLRLNLSSSATEVPVDSTASFPPSGTIQIEGERIAYTEKAATSFTGCTRGYAGTTPAAHNLQTEVVLVSSLPVESTAGFPPSGTVWVGMEKIGYTSLAPKAFLNLTRGVDGTEIYAHRAGVLARCGTYTDDDPEPGSSVALYGVRRRVVPALGVLDQNTLDLLAQERLLALQDLKVWGSATIPAPSFLEDIDVGDEIAIAPEGGGDAEAYRLVGIVWKQMEGQIEIEYGAVREYFLEDLSRLQKGVDLANARGAVAMLGTVLSVSSNGEVAQVLLDDGTTVWARIK